MFVPEKFSVPVSFASGKFAFKKLSTEFAEEDFKAVKESAGLLKNFFGKKDPWPLDNMSFEENFQDLKIHEKEFIERTGFAYSIFFDEKYFGCVYFYPSFEPGFDARVFYWIRKSLFSPEADKKLNSVISKWIQKEWPFKKASYKKTKKTFD